MFDFTTREESPLDPDLAELAALQDERRRIDHRESELLAIVNASGVCIHDHGHSTQAWLADTARISSTTASHRVRVAERLHRHYPALADAFGDGRVGWQHAVVFDRVANRRNRDALVALLPELIALAEVAAFDRWTQELRGIADRLDQDGGYDPATDRSNNRLHLGPLTGGIMTIRGELVGELALTVKNLIGQEADRVAARYRADAQEAGDTSPGDQFDLPSRAQVTAEALCELLERGAGTPDASGSMPTPEIVVVFDAATGEMTDRDGARLSPTLIRWLVAAAMIRPLELSGSGDPLRMGHTVRYANRHQRRALAIRDGGCIFPGCTRPAHWCDAHHVDHWDSTRPADGGTTDVENLGLLCRHHHRVTHRPGWLMTRYESDESERGEVRFQWRTPAGRTIYSQRHHQRWRPAAGGPRDHIGSNSPNRSTCIVSPARTPSPSSMTA